MTGRVTPPIAPDGEVTCKATDDDWTCIAAAGHEGDHAAYGYSPDAPLATWPQDAAHRPAMTMSEINRELDIPKASQGVTGNPNMAGYDHRPAYDCRHCGGHGTEPTHRYGCGRAATAALWHSVAARTARNALADYHRRRAAGTLSADGAAAASDDSPWFQLGSVGQSLKMLLAEIDRQAGGA